jgi:hypothetical protein
MAKAAKKSVTAKNTRNAAAATHARKAKERALDMQGSRLSTSKSVRTLLFWTFWKSSKPFLTTTPKWQKTALAFAILVTNSRTVKPKWKPFTTRMKSVFLNSTSPLGLEEMLAYIERQFETPAPAK